MGLYVIIDKCLGGVVSMPKTIDGFWSICQCRWWVLLQLPGSFL